MSNTVPILYMRWRPVGPGETSNTNLTHPDLRGPTRISYIVALPDCLSYASLSTRWQDNPQFPEGEISIPEIDVLSPKKTWVFDEQDPRLSYRLAILKMKELWQALEVPSMPTPEPPNMPCLLVLSDDRKEKHVLAARAPDFR